MLLLVTTLSLTLSACGGDDEDEPDNPFPETPSEVVKGKVAFGSSFYIELNNADKFCVVEFGNYNDNGNVDYADPSMSLTDGGIRVYKNYYSFGQNLRIIYAGTVNSLKEIKELPNVTDSNHWGEFKKLFEKGGYIIEGSSYGNLYYFRLYISEITYNASGNKIGVSYEWEQFKPSNL